MSIGDRQAFPNPAPPEWSNGHIPNCEEGITYRHLLIAVAMGGLLAGKEGGQSEEAITNMAISQADCLIADLDDEVNDGGRDREASIGANNPANDPATTS